MAGALSDDERQWRRQGLGASDTAGVFQMGYRTPIGVWADKVWGDTESETALMRRGHDLEPLVAGRWSEQTGRTCVRSGMTWSTRWEWLFATLDYWDPERGRPVECKVVDYWGAERWAGGPPAHVQIQAQQQAMVTGADATEVAALFVDDWELREWTIPADPAVASAILYGTETFWLDYVVARRPPPVTDPARDARALGAIPVDETRRVEVDAELVDRWVAAKADERAAKTAAAEGRAALLAAMNGAGLGLVNGTHRITVTQHHRGATLITKLTESKEPR